MAYRTFQSAQWELNPHFRHGKAAGYRYIMGAKLKSDCQRSMTPAIRNRRHRMQEHWVGLEPTSPPYESGILAAGRPVLFYVVGIPRGVFRWVVWIRWGVLPLVDRVGPEGLEPPPCWLRARNAAANTLDPLCSVTVTPGFSGRGCLEMGVAGIEPATWCL